MLSTKIGMLQCSMPDGEDYYVIEQWTSEGWKALEDSGAWIGGVFPQLLEHFPTRKAANEMLEASGLEYHR